MPQSVTYSARRSLISGHTLGGLYSIDLTVREKDRSRRVQAKDAVALSGQTWNTYHRGETLWRLTVGPLTRTALDAMREFLDSVEDGQTFTFDPYNWAAASPSDKRSVILESNSYAESRFVQRGGDQTDDRFLVTFTLREV